MAEIKKQHRYLTKARESHKAGCIFHCHYPDRHQLTPEVNPAAIQVDGLTEAQYLTVYGTKAVIT